MFSKRTIAACASSDRRSAVTRSTTSLLLVHLFESKKLIIPNIIIPTSTSCDSRVDFKIPERTWPGLLMRDKPVVVAQPANLSKWNKILVKFFKNDNPPIKRAKALITFLTDPGCTPQDKQSFFLTNHNAAYRTALDSAYQ